MYWSPRYRYRAILFGAAACAPPLCPLGCEVTPDHVRVSFYVEEHNQRLPHSAFRGQTPDEMYFGEGMRVPDELESGKKAARRKRLAMNRALSCAVCEENQDSDAA